MNHTLIYRQHFIDNDGVRVSKVWYLELEDIGYASAIGGCMARGLADGESIEIHAYLEDLK